jgi:TetR/AcrR family transcriptional regulator, transcriptional repressor for nem operon
MASARRVGAETSKTRDLLLDSVEQLMLAEGYAAVTYRAVATKAGVTPGLVQYYFPNRDDVFLAAIRRRSQQNFDRLSASLQNRPGEPLRVLWEYSQEESTAALTTEFLALGNHRKSIRSEIAEVTERIRQLQLNALSTEATSALGFEDLSPGALLFLVTGIPKLVRLEEGVGISMSHADVLLAFERYLETAEPPKARPAKKRPAESLRQT